MGRTLLTGKVAGPIKIFVFMLVAATTIQASTPQRAHRLVNRNRINSSRVHEAEQRLAELGYWCDSVAGRSTMPLRDALTAFQKLQGRQPTGRLTVDELDALREAHPPQPRDTGYPHFEVDLEHQVLFQVDEFGKAGMILPISSGTGKTFESEGWEREAVTPTGRFSVFDKIPGWHKSPMGELYYPSFIVGGIAIHGSKSVPAYPASHGCIRVPMFAAKALSDLMPEGTKVLVYGAPPYHQPKN
jgi:N-acetylmuramoyl-L-alanine amidase